jgi:putative membrane protein insertion efficiency factor
MKSLVLHLIRLYQLCLSSVLGPRCRFFPTCSTYTQEAIEKHGLWRGSKLGLKRICKCHPFHPGGYDPVQTTADNPTVRHTPRIG